MASTRTHRKPAILWCMSLFQSVCLIFFWSLILCGGRALRLPRCSRPSLTGISISPSPASQCLSALLQYAVLSDLAFFSLVFYWRHCNKKMKGTMRFPIFCRPSPPMRKKKGSSSNLKTPTVLFFLFTCGSSRAACAGRPFAP